jgi:PAS domain-containing protein
MQNDSTLSYHIQVLFDELQARKQKNAMYSMRAFANQLEIHPSALSRAMAGKEELSLQACCRMIKRLPLSEEDKLRFVTSVADEKYERAMKTLSEEFHPDTLVSLTPDRIIIFNREGRYELISPRPLDFVRKSNSSLLGRKPSECGFPEGIAELFEKQVAEVFETGKPSVLEFSIGSSDRKHFVRKATGMLNAEGQIDRVLCHVRQILDPAQSTK